MKLMTTVTAKIVLITLYNENNNSNQRGENGRAGKKVGLAGEVIVISSDNLAALLTDLI